MRISALILKVFVCGHTK